ncbi:MAG: 50S ribosomal protein L11 methyltransferase [Microvirgula sp.]
MAWLQVSIDADSRIAERFADALMELGALSTAIEDAAAGTEFEQPIFGEPGEPVDQLWDKSRIIALFDADADVAVMIAAAAAEAGMALPAWKEETVEAQDWVRVTQAQFDPIRISDRLWITPTWHESPAPDAINLALDPGLAFGTGSHPTTRLCLQWLDASITGGEHILDYGCGSGILAIAALKLGAADAVGIDIDKQAVTASNDNAAQNGVTATFGLPDALTAESQYDVLLANILANPLRVLGDLLASHVRPGGRIVLSGILDEQAEELSRLYSQWFDMDAPVFDEGWTRLTGTRRSV